MIISNPCKKSVKSDIGKPSDKKEALTIDVQRRFQEAIRILKEQKGKNSNIDIISMEWADTVFLCRKGTPVKNSTYDSNLFKICDKAGMLPKTSNWHSAQKWHSSKRSKPHKSLKIKVFK